MVLLLAGRAGARRPWPGRYARPQCSIRSPDAGPVPVPRDTGRAIRGTQRPGGRGRIAESVTVQGARPGRPALSGLSSRRSPRPSVGAPRRGVAERRSVMKSSQPAESSCNHLPVNIIGVRCLAVHDEAAKAKSNRIPRWARKPTEGQAGGPVVAMQAQVARRDRVHHDQKDIRRPGRRQGPPRPLASA